MRKKATPKIPAKPAEIDGVPTADGLVERGREFAYRVPGGIHITDAGYALIKTATLSNINRNYARGDNIWTRPVGSPPIGGTNA